MTKLENNIENRETLAELIVSYWDMKDLVLFAQGQLMDSWNAELVGQEAADESWTSVVEICKEQLDDITKTS